MGRKRRDGDFRKGYFLGVNGIFSDLFWGLWMIFCDFLCPDLGMALKDECMDEKKFVKSGGIYRGDLIILV